MKTNLKNIQEINYILDQYVTLVNSLNNRRNINFPEISEDLTAIFLYGHITNITKASNGDLTCDEGRIEVKAFSSTGPSSFGPVELWDILVFLDATKWKEKYFKCYMLKLKNNSEIWQKIKVNATHLYYYMLHQMYLIYV